MVCLHKFNWRVIVPDFTYKKDSVMVVTDSEYDKCKCSQPLYFSNNGDTRVVLDRPGLFFFMSGVTGHCERGQKMIVKVLDVETPPQSHHKNAALRLIQMKPIMIGYFLLYFTLSFILDFIDFIKFFEQVLYEIFLLWDKPI